MVSTYILEETIDPNHEVLVGWDPGLNTYFIHVIDTTKKEDDVTRDIHWVGCTPDEIHSLVRIYIEIVAYATVPDDMLNKLYADRHKERS